MPGKVVPVNASMPAKKKAHRVPPLGSVYATIAYNPPQPSNIKTIAEGKNTNTL